MLPPICDCSAAPGSGGKKRPLWRTMRRSSAVLRPASTQVRQRSGSNERTRVRRSRETTTPPSKRNRPCGEAGPAPAGDDCNTALVAPRDDLGYVLDGLRQDHGVGAAVDPSRLGLVGQVGRRSAVEDRSRREERAQIVCTSAVT
jgi:hypothetical protein